MSNPSKFEPESSRNEETFFSQPDTSFSQQPISYLLSVAEWLSGCQETEFSGARTFSAVTHGADTESLTLSFPILQNHIIEFYDSPFVASATHKAPFLHFDNHKDILPGIMDSPQASLFNDHPEEPGAQHQSTDYIDRLREYVVPACEALLRVQGHFLFKSYEWPEIVKRLDNEERAYGVWREEQAQLEILMNSKPERPVWLYPESRAQPFHRSLRKELIIAMRRTFESVRVEQGFWEIRQYVERSSRPPLPGGPLELQMKGRYDQLLDMCLDDIRDLPKMLSEDQKVGLRRYNESIGQFMRNFFVVANEIDGKAIWANGFFAQQHMERLGLPKEHFDKCRNSPENRPSGRRLHMLWAEKTLAEIHERSCLQHVLHHTSAVSSSVDIDQTRKKHGLPRGV